jgi:rhodanese-related sulfurtransferase
MRFLTAIVLAVAVTLRAGAQVIDGAPRISLEDFKKLRAAGNVIVVDTRNPDAYAFSHIPGAVLLPLEGLQTWPAEYEKTFLMLKAARKPIVTYCA